MSYPEPKWKLCPTKISMIDQLKAEFKRLLDDHENIIFDDKKFGEFVTNQIIPTLNTTGEFRLTEGLIHSFLTVNNNRKKKKIIVTALFVEWCKNNDYTFNDIPRLYKIYQKERQKQSIIIHHCFYELNENICGIYLFFFFFVYSAKKY